MRTNFFSIHPGRWIGTPLFERKMRPAFGMCETNEDNVKEAVGYIDQQLGAVDKHLSATGWLVCDSISLADIFAFAYVETTYICDYSLDSLQALRKCCETIAGRPSIVAGKKKLGIG